MYPYLLIQNNVRTQAFLLTEDRMIAFKKIFKDFTASSLNFNEGYQLSRTSMKKVFKLKEGRIGSGSRWTFKVGENFVRVGCMRFEGGAFDAIKVWIGDRHPSPEVSKSNKPKRRTPCLKYSCY